MEMATETTATESAEAKSAHAKGDINTRGTLWGIGLIFFGVLFSTNSLGAAMASLGVCIVFIAAIDSAAIRIAEAIKESSSAK